MKFLRKITGSSAAKTLAKGSLVMFIGTMAANVGSYLYHLVMGRMLGPVGYGELSALISILYIFGVPTLVMQTVLVKYFANTKASGELGEAHDIFVRTVKNLTVLLTTGGIAILILMPAIAQYLHMVNGRNLVWVYLFFVFNTLGFVNAAYFQGYQKFALYSSYVALGIFLKLFLSIPAAPYGVERVLLAGVIAGIITYIIIYFPIRPLLSIQRKRFDVTKKDMLKFAVPSFLTIMGFTSMYSTDIILAKHFLPSVQAGGYAALSVLGKIIFYASSAITGVMYPVVSERIAKGNSVNRIILLAASAVTVISILLTLMYSVIPGFITASMFGHSYDQVIPYLGPFAVFISLLSLVYVLSMAHLAMNRVRVWVILISGACIQIAGIYTYHGSIGEILWVNIVVSAVMLIAVSGMLAFVNTTQKGRLNLHSLS